MKEQLCMQGAKYHSAGDGHLYWCCGGQLGIKQESCDDIDASKRSLVGRHIKTEHCQPDPVVNVCKTGAKKHHCVLSAIPPTSQKISNNGSNSLMLFFLPYTMCALRVGVPSTLRSVCYFTLHPACMTCVPRFFLQPCEQRRC